MARNRKRAKERRRRRPTAGPGSRPGVATARERAGYDGHESERDGLEETPSPLEHAMPDAELAEAQLALGRPELARDPETAEPDDFDDDGDLTDYEEPGDDYADGPGASGSAGRELAAPHASAPARRRISGNRLLTFLQGSWRELQRVQWPNRQQVMQATGVVIGFVIVAGLYLGLADTVASKLVTLILK